MQPKKKLKSSKDQNPISNFFRSSTSENKTVNPDSSETLPITESDQEVLKEDCCSL